MMGSLTTPSYDCLESVSVVGVGHCKKKKRWDFRSVDITGSCGNSPVLLDRNLKTNRSDSHLSRLTESIKSALQERGLDERYFPAETTAVSDPEVGLVTSPEMYLKASASDVSLAETIDSHTTQTTTREPDDTTAYKTCDNLAVDVNVDYSPEKANLWKELTNIDVSPVLPQRKSRTFCESAREVLRKIDPSFVQRNIIQQEQPHSSTACKKETKDPDQESLQFKFQYLIVTERLKVTVLNASNMLKSKKLDSEAYTYVEVCLMPGKIQRQLSKVIKVSPDTDTVFDFVAYFQGLSLFEMHQMCLRIKIMGKERLLKTPRVIGEVTVSLDDFDLVSETTLDENFNTRIGTRSGSKYGQRSVLVQ